jgi:hypothetical protein
MQLVIDLISGEEVCICPCKFLTKQWVHQGCMLIRSTAEDGMRMYELYMMNFVCLQFTAMSFSMISGCSRRSPQISVMCIH